MTDLRKMSNEELLQELCNTLQSVGTYRGPRTDAEGKMIMRATGLQVEILSRLDGAAPSEGMKPLSPARSGELSAPQTRAEQYIGSDQEMVFLEKKALGDFAASQPVSGDAPKVEGVWLLECDWHDGQGFQPFGECFYDSEEEANAARLHFKIPKDYRAVKYGPYSPPASQTPDLNAENGRLSCLLQHIADTVGLLPSVTGLSTAAVKDHSVIWMAIRDLQECYKDAARARNGLYTKIEERWNEIATFLDEQGVPAFEPLQLNEPALAYTTLERVKMLATPASTARTDGWIDPENYVAWCRRSKNTIVTCDSDAPGAFKVYRLAAPGSVPQAPNNHSDLFFGNLQYSLQTLFAKVGNPFKDLAEWGAVWEALESARKHFGVPQAEPPKEEKPWITGKL